MNILVTGGAGYIGSHVCKLLSKSGFNPIVFDNLSNGNLSSCKWGVFINGDILKRKQIKDAISKYNPRFIIHLAAHTNVSESIKDPNLYYVNNVIGTLNLLSEMIEGNVRGIIFSSTCAVYGSPKVLPVTEKSLIDPLSPYGSTKFMMEQAIKDYASIYNLKYTIFRYFNVAGADIDCEIGEIHDPEPHLIPRVIKAAIDKNSKIEIYGNDYPTHDGTCIRDYIHVVDIARAHIYALKNHMKGNVKNSVYNLGSGNKGYSVLEIISYLEFKFGEIEKCIKEKREGDAISLYSNIEKVQKKLNWSPKFSSLENIIETAISWHISQ